jgi:hypothetical protein
MGRVGHDVRAFTPCEALGLRSGGTARRAGPRCSTGCFSEPPGCLQQGFNPAGDTDSDLANEGASPVLPARSVTACVAGG